MSKNISVLLVDDRIDFNREFTDEARRHGIYVTSKTNYQEMVSGLPILRGKISAIILDIKCLITPDQETVNEKFLLKAITHLDQNYKEIPRFVLTADSAAYDDFKRFTQDEKIFKKIPSDIEELFSVIKNLKTEEIRIRSLYSDVFEVFNRGYFPESIEVQLLELIKKYSDNEHGPILNNINSIRRIQESLFQTINKYNKSIVPDSCFKTNKDLKFNDAHRHLVGNLDAANSYAPTSTVYYSGLVASSSRNIYNVSSDNGAHNPYDSPEYYPTKYTVQALTYQLFDLIRWFGDLASKHNFK